jgi:hypothetical protein
VELVEVDAIGLERAQGRLARGAQVLGPAVGGPAPLTIAQQAALCGHDQPVARASPQRLGHQPLAVPDVAVVARVRVGGVDEVRAGIQRDMDRPDRLGLVGAPGERHGHLPQADRMHLYAGDRPGQRRRVGHALEASDPPRTARRIGVPIARPWLYSAVARGCSSVG